MTFYLLSLLRRLPTAVPFLFASEEIVKELQIGFMGFEKARETGKRFYYFPRFLTTLDCLQLAKNIHRILNGKAKSKGFVTDGAEQHKNST